MLCALASCSALPPAGYPAYVDYAFEARFTIGDGGSLPLPVSRRGLVIRGLDLAPTPLAERFSGDARLLTYAAGTVVRARGDLRAYRRDDGSLPTLAELLPGADTLR